VQWIADAKVVLGAEIDWQRFLELAEGSGQVWRMREVLGYLASLPGTMPPQEILERLARTRVTGRERVSYLCTSGSIRGVGVLPSLATEHLNATANASVLRTIVSFPGFLRNRWDLAHTWQVPFAVGRRAVRRLGSGRAAA